MIDILLLYPPVQLTGRYKRVAAGREVPPFPLLYLAAVLRQNGFSCEILDANIQCLSLDEIVDVVAEISPRCLGITAPTMLIGKAGIISKAVKKKMPGIYTIVGGPHITVVPVETMQRYDGIDIAVIGEGELTIIELMNMLCRSQSIGNLRAIKGLAFRQNGEILVTEKRQFIQDLDSLPFPAWDMLPNLLKDYQQTSARVGRLPNMSVVTSRGCPYQCIFCARNVFGNVTRTHSADYVIKMIKYLIQRYKIKSISFEDENFVIYKRRLIDFCNFVIEEKIDITWDVCSSINVVTPEILKLMHKAGCWQINYGIESGSQRILDFIKKGTRLETIEHTLHITKEAGIQTKGYFIIGHPTETLESIQQTIDFIKKIDLDVFQMSFMIPFPGTELYEIAAGYGEFKNDWDNMNIWTSLFIPKGLSKEQLEKESKKAYREFYFRAAPVLNYLKRIFKTRAFFKFIKDGFKILKFVILEKE